MGVTARFKRIMKDKHIKANDIANGTGTSLQNIYNTFHTDKMTFATVEKIADILGCDIVFIDRETGKTY